VSLHERLAVVQRIKHGEDVSFSQPMWLARHHVEDRYVAMLPRGQNEITAEEAAMLARVFGKNGELPAERVS
jgi:plasmid maintenance system antidote protein VapI